jgi:hypothetical protein
MLRDRSRELAGRRRKSVVAPPPRAPIADENGTICTVKALPDIAAVASALADVAELIGHPA